MGWEIGQIVSSFFRIYYFSLETIIKIKNEDFPHTLCNIFSNVFVYIIGRVNTSGRVQYSGLMMIKISNYSPSYVLTVPKGKHKHCMGKAYRLGQ